MDRKTLNRITTAFLTVMVLAVVLMLAGSLRRTSRITLPAIGQEMGQLPGEAPSDGALTVVEITPETVQTAIATLSRPEDYRRTVTVEQFWSGGSGAYTISAAVSGGWTRTDRVLPGGRIRRAVTDGETTHIWYDAETAVYTAAAGGISADDEQNIPTYEDILSLSAESITAADYRTLSGVNCIYVESALEEDSLLRYWVSVDTGLLAAAERVQGDAVIYRMTALTLDQTPPSAESFTLPDGTVLLDTAGSGGGV